MTDRFQNKFSVIFYFIFMAALVIGLFFYFSWGRSVEYVDQQIEGETMGTLYSVKVHNFPKNGDWDVFTAAIQKRLDRIEDVASLFKSDSDISKFNVSESLDWFPVSLDTAKIALVALEVSDISGGAFDVTLAAAVNIWGFGVDRRRRSIDEITSELDKIKMNTGYDKLSVRLQPPALKKSASGLKIDFSGVAKGYAVDEILRLCEESGLSNFMIEVGGEVCCRGVKKGDIKNDGNKNKTVKTWQIGIESPVIIPRGEWGEIFQIITINNMSMATSGGNRNFQIIDGLYYSHLIDPRTGKPCQSGNEEELIKNEQLGSVSVLDKSCARADALATAFFVLGEKEGLKIANDKEIPVLFLMRKGKNIKEIPSNSFYKHAKKN
ncbi:MAG: FAD:protein FMN transferase [Planctomycetaceae bacterium]|jgi:thiamine biosynthesis lipoprotein|nr:FAD:protein FMN transferase [Planctomycetaceae bacterium]